jgi:diguanylate cyclase (GGDEF)-like protein/PAS domain S-box-containing protein
MFRVLTCLANEHDWRLIALAGAVCFLASLAAVMLLQRARATQARMRAIWIVAAGIGGGCGIWAAHFIAMLSYQPGVATSYDTGLTVLSLLPAVLGTSTALTLALYVPMRWSAPIGGGILCAGATGMHYVGVWALVVPGRVVGSLDLAIASIALGMILGTAALVAAVQRGGTRTALLAGLLLTLAIGSQHLTAMGAMELVPDPTRAIDLSSLAPSTVAVMIASVTVAMLTIGMAVAILDERFRAQREHLDAALNNISQGLVIFDASTRIVFCNRRYLEMYNLSPAVVKPGCTLHGLISHRKEVGLLSADTDQYCRDILESVASGKRTIWLLESSDGSYIHAVNHPLPGGGWVVTHEDVTERRRAEQNLEQTRAFLDAVVEHVPATLVVKDAREQRYVLINRAAEEFFGISRTDLIGKNVYDLFPKKEAAAIAARDNEALQSGNQLLTDEHPVETPRKGVRFVATKRLAIVGNNGEPQYLLGFIEDMTERKRAEARIAYLAHHDVLTGLPNRAAFNEYLALTHERAAAVGDSYAILCVDVDRFKEINDVFGHSVGDAALCEVSRRLQSVAKGAFIARIGGDEFTLVAVGPQPATAEALAERLIAAADKDIDIDGNLLRIGLSIGIAIFPANGTDATKVLRNGDAALYRAKAEGRGSIRFFEPEMDQRLRERRALQHDLRSAVDSDQLFLHYQPQMRIGGEIIGFEALARWQHPSRGNVPPGTFIPLAEESGLIIPLGERVLREACREAASWPKPLQIAVNFSPVQFRHSDIVSLVHSVLLETGLPASRLEIEITESVLIDDFSRAVSILRRLKSLGVRIAMDDFGTGYSSLSYLQSFPFDKIKIDRSFIFNLEPELQSASIVRTIIGLARGLGVPVLAEGVETKQQLAFLSREACDEVQGYLVGRPCPIANYAEWIGRAAMAREEAALAS